MSYVAVDSFGEFWQANRQVQLAKQINDVILISILLLEVRTQYYEYFVKHLSVFAL